jgi:hypothetical protein
MDWLQFAAEKQTCNREVLQYCILLCCVDTGRSAELGVFDVVEYFAVRLNYVHWPQSRLLDVETVRCGDSPVLDTHVILTLKCPYIFL